MVKITKRLCIVLAMAVFVISFSIPLTLFPSKVYADSVPYAIGDTGPAGGIIFYVNGSSCLEAAPQDITTFDTSNWSGVLVGSSVVTGIAVGDGQANTIAILVQAANASVTAPAAKACDDLVVGAYSDWFLPSKAELNLMYYNLRMADLGGFVTWRDYWSSSESSLDHVWIRNFSVGSSSTQTVVKDGYAKVRAIRAFSGMKEIANTAKPLTPQEQVLLNLSICQQADLYGKTNTGFIKMLYDNILGRVPDNEGLNSWETALNNGMSPNDIVYYFVFSKELNPQIPLMSSEEFVTFLYKNVLDRNSDSDGYNNWVSLMKNGMSKEDVLLLFLNGNEFKNICTMFGLM